MGVGLELTFAIRSENTDKIPHIFERIDAATVNEADFFGRTPLHAAAQMDNVEAATHLVSIPGINVNYKCKSGWTPIKSAAAAKSIQVLEVLIQHPEVDVNARDRNGVSAIMEAAGVCSCECLEILLEHPDVDLDGKCKDGQGLEDVVGIVLGDELNKKSECLEMIRDARRKRGNVSMEEDEDRISLEGMRTNVRKIYIQNIDKVNLQIKEKEQKLKRNLELRITKIKKLEETQQLESNHAKAKLDQKKSKLLKELAKIEDELKKHDQEMKKKHDHEKAILEDKFTKEDNKVRQELASLKETSDQLTKELRKHDMDPDDDASANLEAARNTLECPVCMETMKPPTRIWMCSSNHLVCEVCTNKLEAKLCPTCRTEVVTWRALLAENFARTLFN